MKVRLNLATKPLQSHRRFLAGSGLLGALAAVAFAALGWHVYQVRKANEEMRAKTASILEQVDELEGQRGELDQFFKRPENAKLHERAAFVNNLIDARSFNWTRMFMDLENALPPGVRVISIEPQQDKGRVKVKLTIGATSNDAKLKCVKALEDSQSFTDIQVNAVRMAAPGNQGDPIVVELSAEYARS